jgi:hypothetical protein
VDSCPAAHAVAGHCCSSQPPDRHQQLHVTPSCDALICAGVMPSSASAVLFETFLWGCLGSVWGAGSRLQTVFVAPCCSPPCLPAGAGIPPHEALLPSLVYYPHPGSSCMVQAVHPGQCVEQDGFSGEDNKHTGPGSTNLPLPQQQDR